MTSNLPRRSRRLQGQEPEENRVGVCFICQDDFSIEEVPRLHQTICCGSLLHQQCFHQMFTNTSICGGCGQDIEPEHSRALRMDENIEIMDVISGGRTNSLFLQIRVSDDINYYRQFGLPNPHNMLK